jgi:PAS domain S-box-containing protein
MFTGTYIILQAAEAGVTLVSPALILGIALVAATMIMALSLLVKRAQEARPSRGWTGAARRLVESTSDAVMLLDTQGKVLNANPAAREMFGSADLGTWALGNGTGISSTVSAGGTLFTRQLVKLARSGPVQDYEMAFKDAQGQTRYVSVTTTPITGGAAHFNNPQSSLLTSTKSKGSRRGRRSNVLWVGREITAQKKREAAGAESEERYRAVVEGASEGIFLVDIHTGRFMEANPAFTGMVGYSMEELRGLTLYHVQPHGHDGLDRSLVRLLTEGRCRMGERAYKRKDGSLADVEVSASMVMRDGREAMCAIVHDISERKKSRERLERQLGRMSALRSVEATISASPDLKVTLNVILDHVAGQLGADAASVLLLDGRNGVLKYGAGCGFRDRGIEFTRLRMGEGHAGRAARERRTVYVPEFETNGNGRAAFLEGEEIVSYYALPLIAKGLVKGVLEIFGRTPIHPHGEWVDFAEALAAQAALAIDNASMLQELHRANMDLLLAYDSTLEGWSQALDLRDKETEGHTQRVTVATIRLAQQMGIGSGALLHVRRGALLHDIGKMGIPDSILLKPGPLTDEEWKVMRMHPVYAYKMLAPIPFLRPAIDIPYCHHEKWDGSGYPQGLKGEEIPLAARIFTVVDVWDALRSDRPYRKAWSEVKVREYISSLAGTHFDPNIVHAFLSTTNVWHPPELAVSRGITVPLSA